jgi:hypothetical protein
MTRKRVYLNNEDQPIRRRFYIPKYLLDYVSAYKIKNHVGSDNVALHMILIEFSKINPL